VERTTLLTITDFRFEINDTFVQEIRIKANKIVADE
jgi:hypothetical protein